MTFNLYKIKEVGKDNQNLKSDKNKVIKDLEKKEDKRALTENELIHSINISHDEFLDNKGINIFSMNNGLLSYLFNDSISLQIYYNEKDYTSFFEYISCQLHIHLALILNKGIIKKYNYGIKNIINIFLSLISLYNNEEQKLIYLKNKTIQKVNNYSDLYDDLTNDETDIIDCKEILPEMDYLYNNYIKKEMNEGINKYFIVLIFTEEKFNDLNSDKLYNLKSNFPNNDIYNNSPINFKIFNFGEKTNYIERNDINIKIYKNFNEDIKYNRILFQFYNVNKENNDKKQINKYLNDIPYLIEDFFEIQKMTKFSIFED